MIDNIIKWISKLISKFVLPSTLMKISLLALIISLPLSFIIGNWVIIYILAINNIIWLVNEYLYSKQIEDEDLTDNEN